MEKKTKGITFRTQFDKLTEAYIENKVEPFRACSCFIGNLLKNDEQYPGQWVLLRDHWANLVPCALTYQYHNFYTNDEIVEIEHIFMTTYMKNNRNAIMISRNVGTYPIDIDEDALFKAFEAAIDFLRSVHISKGEVIEEPLVFRKRELVLVER